MGITFLKQSRRDGFTIVELLIVIVVIGILAAISITAFNGVQARGRDSERKTDAYAMRKALESYHALNGHYVNSRWVVNAVAQVELLDTRLKNLITKDTLLQPNAAAGTVSSWGQWAGDVTGGVRDYAYKAFTSDSSNCSDATYADTDCIRYEIYYRSETTGATLRLDSLNK